MMLFRGVRGLVMHRRRPRDAGIGLVGFINTGLGNLRQGRFACERVEGLPAFAVIHKAWQERVHVRPAA